jgi:hypothetical protein
MIIFPRMKAKKKENIVKHLSLHLWLSVCAVSIDGNEKMREEK